MSGLAHQLPQPESTLLSPSSKKTIEVSSHGHPIRLDPGRSALERHPSAGVGAALGPTAVSGQQGHIGAGQVGVPRDPRLPLLCCVQEARLRPRPSHPPLPPATLTFPTPTCPPPPSLPSLLSPPTASLTSLPTPTWRSQPASTPPPPTSASLPPRPSVASLPAMTSFSSARPRSQPPRPGLRVVAPDCHRQTDAVAKVAFESVGRLFIEFNSKRMSRLASDKLVDGSIAIRFNWVAITVDFVWKLRTAGEGVHSGVGQQVAAEAALREHAGRRRRRRR